MGLKNITCIQLPLTSPTSPTLVSAMSSLMDFCSSPLRGHFAFILAPYNHNAIDSMILLKSKSDRVTPLLKAMQ